MTLRTKTYIAGDWTGDQNLIDWLYHWNGSVRWGLVFEDAHELTQARDTSLPCSIKRSLKQRLDASKTFVLVVGNKTASLTRGGCRNCPSYSIYGRCHRSGTVDHRSFIDYECEYAVDNHLRVAVLYNSTHVDKEKCPPAVRDVGIHRPALRSAWDGSLYWDDHAIIQAIRG